MRGDSQEMHQVRHCQLKIGSKPIYEGANGVVFKCSDEAGSSTIVVKRIKIQSDEDSDAYRARVMREYTNVRRSTSKNVIEALYITSTPGIDDLSIVFPFYEKGDLLGYLSALRKNKVVVSGNVKDSVFKQILKGVSYIHRKGIAHRDLKPENFLIDKDGVIKISDFGYSIDVKTDPEGLWSYLHKNNKEIFSGTNSLKAPELFEYERLLAEDPGNMKKIKHEIDFINLDIWSLGICYFHIYAMKAPWSSTNLQEEKDKSYKRYCEQYPKGEKQVKDVCMHLEDPNFSTSSNRALGVFQMLHYEARYNMIQLLNPTSTERISLETLLQTSWMTQVYADSKEFISVVK